MNLRVEVDRDMPSPEMVIVRVEGEVDVYTSPRLKQEIVEQLNDGKTRIIVDLNSVEYLDSTALGVLIGGLKRARERGGDLQLICNNARILRIFEITGLTRIFQIHRSREEALAAPR
ncbi:MAG: STAS domain-containing protein [Armatimonadetes bacterium]|nr:STAS domain-containing protein [Armatimonadota bacterium]